MSIYTEYLDNILIYTTFSGAHCKVGKCSKNPFYERIYLTWGKKSRDIVIDALVNYVVV